VGELVGRNEKRARRRVFASGLAEWVSALATEQYLNERAARSSAAKFRAAMAQVPDAEPEDFDR
jgi:hypothetical protein